MGTTMKGLLKGLRYITHIFDEEKEPEMQIGLPTDVKHVAHIGWDGPSANAKTPTWMNELKGPEPLNSMGDVKNQATKLSSEDINQIGTGIPDSLPPNNNEKQKHKSRRRASTGGASPLSSPTKRGSDVPKQPRRPRSPNISMDSPGRDSPSRLPRRNHKSNVGIESPSQDQPAIPKHSRHRKSKGSSGGESVKSSRSKEQNPLTGTCPFTDLGTGYECMNVSKSNEDGNSKGIE